MREAGVAVQPDSPWHPSPAAAASGWPWSPERATEGRERTPCPGAAAARADPLSVTEGNRLHQISFLSQCNTLEIRAAFPGESKQP